MEIDSIELFRSGGKRGATIARKHYAEVVQLILARIATTDDGAVPLSDLIEHAQHKLLFGGDIPWYLINVKQDLEERGILKTHWDHLRMPYIRLGGHYKKNMAQWKRVTQIEFPPASTS
ncbi:DUF6958 family protein [Chryseolinea lacunae]|uniref:Uncharacterized protein n=1 Tax=Chryseolinea lacunae TaxID=2801331 RepID=A0ABS1L4D9_9BACT|nr:hypothetical protein [Chryseolinea lacunae]MBL0745431.1 hypothetical protein [Chryseolinea lacunae]